jgi:hypothetical protein
MNWKAWILALVLFITACLLGDLVLTYGVIYHDPSFDTNRILHLYHESGDEIPMFGDSKIHNNYDPRTLGLNTYNYGMDASSFEVTDVLLQIELAKPKTTPIILEPQFADSGRLGDPAKFIPLVSEPGMRRLLKRFHVLAWWHYFPGLRYFGQYDVYLRHYFYMRTHPNWRLVHGFSYDAQQPPFEQARLDDSVRKRLQSRTGYFPDEDQERRLIAHITQHPERLFFLVYSPYHPCWFAHFENAEKLKQFQERLQKFPNVVLIDLSRQEYPDEFFYDSVHMLQTGSADFSRKVGEEIRQALRERNGTTAVTSKAATPP